MLTISDPLIEATEAARCLFQLHAVQLYAYFNKAPVSSLIVFPLRLFVRLAKYRYT